MKGLNWFLIGVLTALCVPVCLAASADSELDKLLSQASSYTFGQSREALTSIDQLIRTAGAGSKETSEIAARMAAALGERGTPDFQDFLCRWLGVIGSSSEVPVLVPLLAHDRLADSALYALARIPGETADEALIAALANPQLGVRVSVINALAQRRAAKAVTALIPLLQSTDNETVAAAAAGLGKIAGAEAGRALLDRFDKASSADRPAVADACLIAAENLLRSGKPDAAVRIYSKLFQTGDQAPYRVSAFLGLVRSQPTKRLSLVLKNLNSNEPELVAAAVRLVREIPGAGATREIATRLNSLPPDTQARVLLGLGARGDKSALSMVLASTRSAEQVVRLAALQALGELGDASVVGVLAQAAATATGAEQETARTSLVQLPGEDVDGRLIASLRSETTPAVRAEYARALGPRAAAGAVPVLLVAAHDAQEPVRAEAVKALGQNAAPRDMPALVQLLLSIRDEAERQEMEKTVIAASRRITNVETRSQSALTALASSSDPAIKSSLLTVLGRMCGSAALEAVRGGLKDENPEVRMAAMRSLSNWEDTEALDVLLGLSRSETTRLHQTLALRGYIRLLGQARELLDSERLDGYKEAMHLASADDERKQALSGVSGIRTLESLVFVVPFLDDPGVKEEAAAAAVQIAYLISDLFPKETEQAMTKVLAVSQQENTRRLATLASSPEGRKQAAARRFQRERARTGR